VPEVAEEEKAVVGAKNEHGSKDNARNLVVTDRTAIAQHARKRPLGQPVGIVASPEEYLHPEIAG
jgi:hypothetical protein